MVYEIQGAKPTSTINSIRITELQNEDGQSYKSAVVPLKGQKWVPQTINQEDYTSVEKLRKLFPSTQYHRDDNGCMMTSDGHTTYAYESRESGETTYVSFHKNKKGATVVEIEHSKSFDDKNKVYARYENGKLVKVQKGPNSRSLCYYIE